MSKFDEISEVAIDNYGVVTAAEAVKMGVALKDAHEWVHSGRRFALKSATMKSARPTNTRNSYLKNLRRSLRKCSSHVRSRFGL